MGRRMVSNSHQAFLALSTAFAAFAIACSNFSSPPAVTPTPSPNPSPTPGLKLTPFPTLIPVNMPRFQPTSAAAASDPAALALLKRSTEVAKDIEGMRSSVNIITTSPRRSGSIASIAMDMETIKDGSTRMVMRMDHPGGEQKVEMILLPPDVYSKVDETGWVKMDMEMVAGPDGQSSPTSNDPGGVFNHLFPTKDIPWEIYTVQSLGRDEVDGVEVARLSIEVDFEDIWRYLSEEERAQLRRDLANPTDSIDDLMKQIELTKMESWIDDAGYNRRNKMRIVMGGVMNIDMDMRMFDFNSDITINPPESFLVMPVPTATSQPTPQPPAVAAYDEALRLNPQNAMVYNNRGKAYNDLGEHQRAIEDLNEAIRLDPKLAWAYNNRGNAYNELGEHQRAIEDLNEAIRLDPKLAWAYNNRGVSYDNLGEHRRAIEDYDEAIRLDPKLASAYNYRGNAYANLGEHQRAIEDLNEAIRLDPKLAPAYNYRGYAYNDLGEHRRAIEDYDEAIRLDPKLASAYNYRGNAYANLGEHQRAIEDYDEAIRLDPKLAWAFGSRGASYGNLGEHRRAIEDYDEALRLDPKLASAYNYRGISYGNLGEHQRAIEDYDEALRLDPQEALAYNNRGLSYGNLGEYQRAIEDYDEALRLDPQEALAYANRALLYTLLGNDVDAERDAERAIELGLDRVGLESAIEEVKRQR